MAGKATQKQTLYQIKISLTGSPLPIWRRLLIDSEMPLSMAHEALQIVMGWWNYHLYEFAKGKDRYGVVSDFDEDDTKDADEYELSDLLKSPQDKCVYRYDFGDGWEHELLLEKVVRSAANESLFAQCLHGKRACPPEDCGGLPGFLNCISAVEDPLHPEHKEMLLWTGASYDPNAFDVRMVNLQLNVWEADLQEKAEFVEMLKAAESAGETEVAIKKSRPSKGGKMFLVESKNPKK